MKFQIQEATPSDLEAAKTVYSTESGDLCAAAFGFGWPLSDPNDLDAAKRRAEWSCQQQKQLMEKEKFHLQKIDLLNLELLE